ncbi:hypothetical protein [Pseudomonas sp. DG56-2]|uniref:hypothetical protein n=1 Tax=Pseudomonas sp. DG56-2 TaxID=2320270 RepID=UPI0010A6B118|nr:hypothetical protein [Pseudomonas sp. DG56-2]
MKIDRALQKKILEHLREVYPRESSSVTKIDDPSQTLGNLYYLRELGLIDIAASDYVNGTKKIHHATITAKGIDFLEDDGGVGAILGTLTVKLHEDTLRQLIEAKVQSASLPEEQKSSLLKALREAPGDAIKQLTTKLVEAGLDHGSKAGPLLQTWIQNALA